jgi:hypothetical protein
VLIGLAVPRLLRGFLPTTRPIKAGVACAGGRGAVDIVVSNIVVARLVLGPMSRPPAWVPVPLALTTHGHRCWQHHHNAGTVSAPSTNKIA